MIDLNLEEFFLEKMFELDPYDRSTTLAPSKASNRETFASNAEERLNIVILEGMIGQCSFRGDIENNL